MDPKQKLGRLVTKHALYPGFVEFLRRTAHRTLAPRSFVDRLKKIDALRHAYGTDLLDPDSETTLRRVEMKGVTVATLEAYRFVLKQWLTYLQAEPDARKLQTMSHDA